MPHPCHRRRPITLLAAAVAATMCAAGAARAEPKYVGWTKVEACREIRELKEKLREGGQVDANARLFLEETALPQLALDENRALIERTRRRIRDLLLGDLPDEKSYGEVSLLIAEFMTALARDEQAEPVVRVNAMLLVSELKGRNDKPWPPAALALAAAAGDKGLPDAVRIAALTGVAKHVAAGGGDDCSRGRHRPRWPPPSPPCSATKPGRSTSVCGPRLRSGRPPTRIRAWMPRRRWRRSASSRSRPSSRRRRRPPSGGSRINTGVAAWRRAAHPA
jgi:hypothetical protein